MNTKVVIFNYNLPEESDIIYNKLILDGFLKKDVFLVDNGSDKAVKAENTNFSLPINVRFTGQAFMFLTYLLKFIEFDNVLLVTTSAGLKDDINYLDELNALKNDFNGQEFGFISASLNGGLTDTNAPEQSVDNITSKYKEVYAYQPIATLVSKRLLELCSATNSAYFNLDLKRGWGIDRELQYIANKNNLRCFVSRDFTVEWRTNLTYNKNMADESKSSYHGNALQEMQTVLVKKYGLNWEALFKESFYKGKVDFKEKVKSSIKGVLTKFNLYQHFK
ncbi:hypothetical protein [Aeromonas enteropelogenes]|uniref:hypothetical protein n=1 Tax=Aeromonas enteropelogenes TaxID=29489 RepID=UPI0038D0F952